MKIHGEKKKLMEFQTKFKSELRSEAKWTNQRRNRSGGGQIVVASCFR